MHCVVLKIYAGFWLSLKTSSSTNSLHQIAMKDHSDLSKTYMYLLSKRKGKHRNGRTQMQFNVWNLLDSMLCVCVGLEFFRHVLLVSCTQDHWIPFHSSRIELSQTAANDKSQKGSVHSTPSTKSGSYIVYRLFCIPGKIYRQMVSNILKPVVDSPNTTLVRYDVFFGAKSSMSTKLSGSAHADVAAHPVFLDKFINVIAPKYFL